jgi:hypothetical protein
VGPMDGRPGQAIVVKLVCRGACREFSDYDFEGLGGPSGWARIRCRTDALRKHPDFERIGLDRPDAAAGRARAKARDFCRCICAAGRPRLVDHGIGQAVLGFAGSADSRPPRRAGATARTPRDGRCRAETGPADASTGCRQHAHLAARSRSGCNSMVCVIAILTHGMRSDQVVHQPGFTARSNPWAVCTENPIRVYRMIESANLAR